MQTKVIIDPVTRIEGHLAIRIEVESNRISKAFCSGEMFRGFEVILKGRNPLDAQQIVQRICGVCPVSHGLASVLAQDAVYSVNVPQNGILVRNLIQAANYIQSHIIHFYQLCALDFVDIMAITSYQGKEPALRELKSWVQSQLTSHDLYPAAPFMPRYSGDYARNNEFNATAIKHYLDAFEMRALAHKMGAVFGGKLPHSPSLVPGGVTEKVTADKISAYRSMLRKLQVFIDEAYLPDVMETAALFPDYLQVGKGCGNFLCQGGFPEPAGGGAKLFPSGVLIGGNLKSFDPGGILEEVKHSYYALSSGLHPARGQTVPDTQRGQAYSWIKAPRYQKNVMEVGPLARILLAYQKGENQDVKRLVDDLLKRLNRGPEVLTSVMGRHAARAIECKILADRSGAWLDQLNPEEPAFQDFQVPGTGAGAGLTEAPRGALGHWIEIQNGKIENYQCVVPTTWNCSPRDDKGNGGAVEQALEGTPIADVKNPIEAARVVRSFDPCLACAVH